jgi:DNA-binding IclR family transcriptional regulator
VEIAGRLLKTLAQLEGPQTLKDLSTAAAMSPAKAHRYLVSLIREGLIEQSTIDGRYDFGGAAREIGRAAINRLDIMRIGAPLLVELRNVLQQTVFLAYCALLAGRTAACVGHHQARLDPSASHIGAWADLCCLPSSRFDEETDREGDRRT